MPTKEEYIAAAIQRIKRWVEATGYDPIDEVIYTSIAMELQAIFEAGQKIRPQIKDFSRPEITFES